MDFSGIGPPILFHPVVTIRTIGAGRPALGRWEVYDAAGSRVGVVAEEPAKGDFMATFTVIHNPTGVPFRPPAGRRLSALGAWSSTGHRTVPTAVATLVEHLTAARPTVASYLLEGTRDRSGWDAHAVAGPGREPNSPVGGGSVLQSPTAS